MKFGAMVATKIDDWQLLQYAEQLGYDHGWVPGAAITSSPRRRAIPGINTCGT